MATIPVKGSFSSVREQLIPATAMKLKDTLQRVSETQEAPHSALLMTEFYKNLRTASDKAQTLRQAMLTTRQRYADPLCWAAFTLIGEAE